MNLIELYPRVAKKPRLFQLRDRRTGKLQWVVAWDGHQWRMTLRLGKWFVNTDTARIVEYERRLNRPRDPICPVADWPVLGSASILANAHGGGRGERKRPHRKNLNKRPILTLD
jgi:hypothetical protein